MAKRSSSSKARTNASRAPRASRTETGQGLSISTIIIAALGLIVLVVLVAVFTGQMGKTVVSVEKEKRGLVCEGTDGLGGTWNTDSCAAGKNLYPTNPDDLSRHAGQFCCAP